MNQHLNKISNIFEGKYFNMACKYGLLFDFVFFFATTNSLAS